MNSEIVDSAIVDSEIVDSAMESLIYVQDSFTTDHLPMLYKYIRNLEPIKILIIGPKRRSVCQKLIQKKYPRCHRSTLGRDLKSHRDSSSNSSVLIVDTLAVQSRTCKEVKILFEDPNTVVICCVRSPTDLRPESRKYVNEVIIAGELSPHDLDKLRLCYSHLTL